jgi:hypothetical protein
MFKKLGAKLVKLEISQIINSIVGHFLAIRFMFYIFKSGMQAHFGNLLFKNFSMFKKNLICIRFGLPNLLSKIQKTMGLKIFKVAIYFKVLRFIFCTIPHF